MNNYTEKFCLRWDEFETNIRESFRELREEKKHFDVTLACEDDHQIKAHKIILSAGSKFFGNIFGISDHPNPFIYLKGIKKAELECVLDFLYNGEAYIAQEELNKFLEIAQDLNVKGLQRNDWDERGQNPRVNKKDFEDQFTEMETKYSSSQDPEQHANVLETVEELAATIIDNDVAFVQQSKEENR